MASGTGSKKAPAKKSTAKKPAASPKKQPVKKPAPKKFSAAKRRRIAATRQESTVPSRHKSIAQRTVAWKTGKTGNLLRWIAIGFLLLTAAFFQFCMLGYSFTVLVCICTSGILLFYNILYLLRDKFPRGTRTAKRMFTFLLCVGLLICGITEAVIIHASFGDPEESCEYVVVLGAKVRPDGPSVSLMDRIRAAAEYLEENPEVTAIVSGGKGADEPIAEAKCMYDELVALGIDPNRIWMEDKATSTWENLHFSLNLIEKRTGNRPAKIGILSSEYHLFRASLFAKACHVESVGIPAATSRLSQRINHFMREVAGVWHYILLGGQYNA